MGGIDLAVSVARTLCRYRGNWGAELPGLKRPGKIQRLAYFVCDLYFLLLGIYYTGICRPENPGGHKKGKGPRVGRGPSGTLALAMRRSRTHGQGFRGGSFIVSSPVLIRVSLRGVVHHEPGSFLLPSVFLTAVAADVAVLRGRVQREIGRFHPKSGR